SGGGFNFSENGGCKVTDYNRVDGVTVFSLPERSQMPGDLHTIATLTGRTFSNAREFAHHPN
ncbi:MAG: hypothetical protein MJY71_06675, partial [Bacteroidaceae bacterium]|nr:hypothetical protein [Bacteroidaceae bacterium]